MTARPVVTMDETDETLWRVDPDHPSRPVYLGFIHGDEFNQRAGHAYTWAEIRAIADFLQSLDTDSKEESHEEA